MPIHVTFDLMGAGPHDLGRIQSMFERFGWQRLGESSYRYPRADDKTIHEDWLNRVIPALMLFRTYVVTSGRQLSNFSIFATTSAILDTNAGIGTAPTNELELWQPTNQKFGAKNLWAWLDSISYPYTPDGP